MTKLDEFKREASDIMAESALCFPEDVKEIIGFTKKMYALKAKFFPKFHLTTIKDNYFIGLSCCPACLVFGSNCNICFLDCLKNGDTNWYKMNEAMIKGNRRKFTYWFRKLKAQIDTL